MSAPMMERVRPAAHSGDHRFRVLIASDTYPPDVNGAAYFTHRLAVGLADRGHDVHVLCQSDDGPPAARRVDGVMVHRLRSVSVLVHRTMRVAVPLGLTKTVHRLMSGIAPDVLHVQGHLVVGRAAMAAAHRAGIGVVATNHFMPDNLLPYVPLPARLAAVAADLAWRDLGRVFGRAAHVTTPTPIAARLLADKGLARPVEPVSCGIDLSRFRPRPGEQGAARARLGLPERSTMLFVGRLDAEKHLEEPIRALAMVLNDTDAQFVVVGTGRMRAELERLAAAIGVGDRVHLLGFVPDDGLADAYAAADVFVMPGVAELQSIATLEAMASGLPVVAADALALPHLVRRGENGYLYPPGDVPVLARLLTGILTAPATLRRMGAVSRAMAEPHDHERSLERFECIYAQVGGRVSAAGAAGTPRR